MSPLSFPTATRPLLVAAETMLRSPLSASRLVTAVTAGTNPRVVVPSKSPPLSQSFGRLDTSTMTMETAVSSKNKVLIVDDDHTTTIRSLKEFVKRIPDAVQQRKRYDIDPGSYNDPIANLFRQSDLPRNEWQQYAFFDTSKPYTRNLIATDNKTYTLMLLCWNPGQESPIHSHPCDGCWLQVMDGQIREVRYDTDLKPFSDTTYQPGQLSWITDYVGYHKVGNASPKVSSALKEDDVESTSMDHDDSISVQSTLRSGQPAATLHLYSPPFKECHFWRNETDSKDKPSIGKNIHYSEYGFLCSQDTIP